MKRTSSLAVAATLLLSVYACAAEDSAEVTADSAAKETRVAQNEPEATVRPEAMTREQARAATEKERLRAEAAANDKLSVITPGTQTDAQPKQASAPPDAVTARNISDPALVARGDQQFKAGRDYMVLTPAQRTSSPPEKIEITEVFMYQCPHCFSFEPFVDDLIKEQPAEVNVVRMPAIFNPIAELHAKAYYASKVLGVWEQLHTPFFSEIHTKRNMMRTEDSLLDFIAGQGIDRTAFANALRSFEVDSKVRDAKDLNRRYRIDSVPTIVINGKYVTSASLVQSNAKLREVIDYLVSKEGQEL